VAFDRVLKPGESVVVPFGRSGFWWQRTIGTWTTQWTLLSLIGVPQGNHRVGLVPPRVTWVEVRN
jgi:hypothetical protein